MQQTFRFRPSAWVSRIQACSSRVQHVWHQRCASKERWHMDWHRMPRCSLRGNRRRLSERRVHFQTRMRAHRVYSQAEGRYLFHIRADRLMWRFWRQAQNHLLLSTVALFLGRRGGCSKARCTTILIKTKAGGVVMNKAWTRSRRHVLVRIFKREIY